MIRPSRLAFDVVALLAAGAWVGSCAPAAKKATTSVEPVQAVPTEAPLLAEPDPAPPTEDEAQRRLSLMEQALKHRAASVDAPANPPAPAEPAQDEAASAPVSESQSAPMPAAAGQSNAELVSELAAQIREQAKGSSAPAAALLRLAALEIIDPSASGGVPDENALTPGEVDFLRAWRELFQAARDGLNSSGDIGPLASRVADLAERMQAAQPLSVIDSRLCLRVDGYGMYNEMARAAADRPYVLTAGRRARIIVYTELSNYTHTPAKKNGVEGFEVRLAQDLTLYHAGSEGDTVVWRRPFQDINDFSRKRRRDFYTTQIVELPATLGVGAYRLKVSVSDKSSAAAAESIVPIEYVAEASPRR